MKQLFKTFKPWDFLFIGIALVLSFTPLFITTFIYTDKVDAPVAIVKIDGEEVDRFILSEDAGHIEKTYYPHEGEYNIIEQDGEYIRDKEDNSPYQIAVRTGWINEPGDISVCLPHGLIIEIQGEHGEDELILPKK
ncbi:hypothetical protein CYJ27_00655 [Aerococcus christensenii]|uniref:Uncharacterized protein n=1 Tax=Aerococcus christensenii TaxID=87541 RepID=A0A2I1K8L5_9LACT|nr:NusG domain II-containing protein [Aerococcus christensenii]MDK8233243.1 NusG domain II-containing protein [Aerococcus christensenii]PKY91983.1 hypothetical protein CYJ27_00655 [Aerococcus christensenii]WEB70889.1 NusG domain II-containing protein [Aerococcus christensenii]